MKNRVLQLLPVNAVYPLHLHPKNRLIILRLVNASLCTYKEYCRCTSITELEPPFNPHFLLDNTAEYCRIYSELVLLRSIT